MQATENNNISSKVEKTTENAPKDGFIPEQNLSYTLNPDNLDLTGVYGVSKTKFKKYINSYLNGKSPFVIVDHVNWKNLGVYIPLNHKSELETFQDLYFSAIEKIGQLEEKIANRRRPIPQKIRNQVYARSKGICERCGLSGEHIHHIDKDHKNNSLNNLTHLCVPCHRECHKRKK